MTKWRDKGKRMLTIEEILAKGGPSPLQALDYLHDEAREHEGAYKDFRVRTKMRHACRRVLLQQIVLLQRYKSMTTKQKWPKECACGKSYHREQWAELDLCGQWDDEIDFLWELRSCTCGSTIGVILGPSQTADTLPPSEEGDLGTIVYPPHGGHWG